MNPLSLALALVVAALIGATALLGIVRRQAIVEQARPTQAGRGRRRSDGDPDRPRGWRPAHRGALRDPQLDGWPLVGVAVVCCVVVVGMLVTLASGPAGAAARMLADVSAVILGWVAL